MQVKNHYYTVLVCKLGILQITYNLNPSFFELAILNFFFQKQKKIFAAFLFKLVTIYGVPRIFQNFDDYPDFQEKSRGV